MIEKSWQVIDAKLDATPEISEKFAAGASDQALEDAATTLEVSFPTDFIESYRIHDGQVEGIEFLFGPYRLWNLAELVRNHEALIASGCDFGKKMIGFADNGGSATLAMQCADGTERGAVFDLSEDGEEKLANSFAEFLADLARQIDAGELVWDEVAGGFSSLEDMAESERMRPRMEAWQLAVDGPSRETVEAMPPGADTDVLGGRTGRASGTRCQLATATGIVQLNGSLRGATFNQPIRVRIRVGRRRLLGLLSPIHEILSWEPLEQKT